MRELEVPVLVVGGGPVGLSASLLLSRHGVQSLLVERRSGTSAHPKARGLNVRTLELFRVWGIEEAVRAAAGELERARDVVWAPTLVAAETKRLPHGGAGEHRDADSPTTTVGCAQENASPRSTSTTGTSCCWLGRTVMNGPPLRMRSPHDSGSRSTCIPSGGTVRSSIRRNSGRPSMESKEMGQFSFVPTATSPGVRPEPWLIRRLSS